MGFGIVRAHRNPSPDSHLDAAVVLTEADGVLLCYELHFPDVVSEMSRARSKAEAMACFRRLNMQPSNGWPFHPSDLDPLGHM